MRAHVVSTISQLQESWGSIRDAARKYINVADSTYQSSTKLGAIQRQTRVGKNLGLSTKLEDHKTRIVGNLGGHCLIKYVKMNC